MDAYEIDENTTVPHPSVVGYPAAVFSADLMMADDSSGVHGGVCFGPVAGQLPSSMYPANASHLNKAQYHWGLQSSYQQPTNQHQQQHHNHHNHHHHQHHQQHSQHNQASSSNHHQHHHHHHHHQQQQQQQEQLHHHHHHQQQPQQQHHSRPLQQQGQLLQELEPSQMFHLEGLQQSGTYEMYSSSGQASECGLVGYQPQAGSASTANTTETGHCNSGDHHNDPYNQQQATFRTAYPSPRHMELVQQQQQQPVISMEMAQPDLDQVVDTGAASDLFEPSDTAGCIDELMLEQLGQLDSNSLANDEKLQVLRDLQEECNIKNQDRIKAIAARKRFYEERHNDAPSNTSLAEGIDNEIRQLEIMVRSASAEIRQTQEALLSELCILFAKTSALLNRVVYEYLPTWHMDQQLEKNDAKANCNSLDQIQRWCELLTDILWRTRNQLKALTIFLGSVGLHSSLQDVNHLGFSIDRAIETLILNSLVVEKQPPRVMKTNSRFGSTVRFLCGSKLNIRLNNPRITVNILSESTARAIREHHLNLIARSWAFLDSPVSSPQTRSDLTTSPPLSTVSSSTAAPTNQSMASPLSQAQPDYTHVIMSEPGTGLSSPSSSSPAVVSHQTVIYQTPPIAKQEVNKPFYQSHQQQLPPQQHLLSNTNHLNSNIQPLTATPKHQPAIVAASHIGAVSSSAMCSSVSSSSSSSSKAVNPKNGNTNLLYQPQEQLQEPSQLSSCSASAYQQKNKFLNIKNFETSADILNSENQLEYGQSTGQVSCNFKNMQLKKIKRPEKKGTESVMDEKFILLFHSQFRIADGLGTSLDLASSQANQAGGGSARSSIPWINQADMTFHLMAFSMPVAVIVHGNQEPDAWATITWHNAFAKPDGILYSVPETVYWQELGQVLSDKFNKTCGKSLNEEQLKYLGSKVCRSKVLKEDQLVSWTQFSKENMLDKNFTFWQWFYSIIKLTKEHLRDLWTADRIYGFIGKGNCHDLLMGSKVHQPRPEGTFLLRFSETELGGITIAWVTSSSKQIMEEGCDAAQLVQKRRSPSGSPSTLIQHLRPLTGKDLTTRMLADRVKDLDVLTYLYPDKPKRKAFYTIHHASKTVPPDGYVDTILVQKIDECSSTAGPSLATTTSHSANNVKPMDME